MIRRNTNPDYTLEKFIFSTAAAMGLWLLTQAAWAQEKKDLKINLDSTGKHYVQFVFLNQVWLRYNQSNPATTVEGVPKSSTFDIGLRRTRFQLLAQISDRVMFYGQLGMNNFNSQYNSLGGNRKVAFFIHDALGEYKVSKGNQLKLGAGLTITNGLSRFSQPSVGTIMTLDVPVFAQSTVDQTDQFSRKLSVYARGQVGHLDYRVVLSDPFPITSGGNTVPPVAPYANFSPLDHKKQVQSYLIWQFFEHEQHTTSYMTGTYLGTKKIFNLAAGAIHHANAMWKSGNMNDTLLQNMTHYAIESFLDMPVNKQKGSAVSAYIGYFNMNYGTNFLRNNGIMNPANGLSSNYTSAIKGQGSTYGNALPMFGTGQTVYSQFGYLLPAKHLNGTRFMPYAAVTLSKFDRLQGENTFVSDLGINVLLNGHKSKISIDWQTRPTYTDIAGKITSGPRKNSVIMQYQILF